MISITMQFQDLAELQAFLATNGSKPLNTVEVTPRPPAKKKAAPKKKAAAVVDITPEAENTRAASIAAVTGEEAPAVDLVALRDATQKALIAKNETFNDGNVKIVAFIKTFGVNRLSELPDTVLVDFAAQLDALV